MARLNFCFDDYHKEDSVSSRVYLRCPSCGYEPPEAELIRACDALIEALDNDGKKEDESDENKRNP